jgi:plasmid stabilization system protein ParE
MKGYVLSPRAQKDIDDIWEYTVEHWNVRQAEIYLRQIQRAIEIVAAEPKIAWDIGNIRRGRTCCFFGSRTSESTWFAFYTAGWISNGIFEFAVPEAARNSAAFPCISAPLRLERRHVRGPRTPGGLPRRSNGPQCGL